MYYIKKLLAVINNFIQWTKKWHFFHVFIIPPFLFSFTCIILYFIFFIILIVNQIHFSIYEFLMNDIVGVFICLEIFLYFIFLIIAIALQILFIIINLTKHQNINIKNEFILKNKKYNGIYILALINAIVFLLT